MTDQLIIPCSSCRTLNRVPRTRLGDIPVCSECRTRLLGQKPAELGAADFDRFVLRSDLPVLVDFWAPWCGPCRMMAPHFEKASQALAGRAILAKVDTEQHPDLAARFGIRGIPTLILFDHGQEIARTSGAMQTGQVTAWVDSQAARR